MVSSSRRLDLTKRNRSIHQIKRTLHSGTVAKEFQGGGTKSPLHDTAIEIAQMPDIRRLGVCGYPVGPFHLGQDFAKGFQRSFAKVGG